MNHRHYWIHFTETENNDQEDWLLILSKTDNSPSCGTLRRTDRRNEWKFTITTHCMCISCLIAGETKRGAMAKCVKVLKALNKMN